MPTLTYYGTSIADTTLTNACVMAPNSGGTETSKLTTIPGTSNPYAEILSQGGSSTAVAALPSPTGHGWVFYPGAGSFAAGTWTLLVTKSSATKGVSSTFRVYKIASGTYTSVGTATVTNSSTAKTTYTFSISGSGVSTGSSDGIYIDGFHFNNNANAGTDNPTIYVGNSATAGVAGDMQLTTPTFTPAATTFDRTIPATFALQSSQLARIIPATFVLKSSQLARIVPASLITKTLDNHRNVPANIVLANTFSRLIPATLVLSQPSNRLVPASFVLKSIQNARTVPASMATTRTLSRVVPASISLSTSAVFYASNIAQTQGGLTLSDQMSTLAGGVETSVSVTAPSSGTNTYVELLAQGGSSSGTPVLPAPTGRGWSISLAGNTILAGNWSSIFTLSKSGTTKTGASLIVRYYRRTMDGTLYPIGVSTLTSQSFSTTKSVYITPSVLQSWPFQFIQGDTLYMDAFVLNSSTAWASDVFTVYVSNSATQGVYNDGTIIAPEMISTPDGLSCLIGATNFQTGDYLPVKDQSISIADAVDQRSIATLTGEDVDGTLSYQRAMPVQLSDSDQGVLYTGAVNADKASKPAAGNSNAQLEHALTFMDNHYLVDKRKNDRNYLNWSAGDMMCDFIQQTLYQEGITGQFALESDYTPETFGQGTLSGTVATDTTSPFTYAPNTATPPITSNTGDLELTRAGTKFTLTEATTSDFSSGALTNMTASNNELVPNTQNALKVTATYSPIATAKNSPAQASGGTQTSAEITTSQARIYFWNGSMTVGTNDTFHYDLWISSTSPAIKAGVNLLFSDGTSLASYDGTLDDTGDLGLFDQNGVSVGRQTDLSAYAKDTWYSRSITMTGLNGKTITAVYVYITGDASGDYTVFAKNIYLQSQSGSPFFSTTATVPQTNPPTVKNTIGGYLINSVNASVASVYDPLASYRVSPAHSISGVGLIQNSTITWTASLPASASAITYPPGVQSPNTSTSGAGAMLMLVSYDGNAWLQCQNGQALPGLPPGANVSGLSLYLREQFAGGSDPSAIPALLNVSITINSAANQTVSDIVTVYGTSTQWNTGTQVLTGPNANGNLTLGSSSNPLTQNWPSSAVLDLQTFLAGWNNAGTQAVSGGAYTMTTGANPAGGAWCQSRFEWAGYFQDGTIEADVKVSASTTQCGIEYRQTGWGNANNNGAYFVYIVSGTGVRIGYGQNSFSNTDGTFTIIGSTSHTINTNTYYHLKIVVRGNRHTVYFNNNSTPDIDIIDNTYPDAGQIGVRCFTGGTSSFTASIDNFSMVTTTSGTWTSPSTSLSSLGTCGYNQVSWTELDSRGQIGNTAIVLASTDNGSTWMQCTNGAEIPQLARGTSTSGMNLKLQMILYSATPPITTPVVMGLYVRICGNYGTVTGTRISPALSLTPVGYVAASNCMWNANIPTGTSLVVATTQDLSSFHTVGNNGAGEALPYWTPQPSATQDLFATNTASNYTNTSKSGGSVASVTYETAMSRITLSGGSSALYVNLAINAADVDMLVDMDRSEAGGMVFRFVDTDNFYEVGIYDASSSSGFTNQLRLYKVASGTRTLLGSASATFTRGTVHRPRVSMQGGLINVYWDGACKISYLDTSPLAGGACGLRNDGGTSRYYQLWVQPLGTNLSGQKLHTKVTMTTTDPAMMPQLFTLVCCVRGPNIATGATISQLHPVTKPVAAYYHAEMDTLTQASGDYFWLVDKWREMHFGERLARPGAFPVQSTTDQSASNPLNVTSGYLLYRPQVTVLSSADLFRNRETITNVSGLVTPPAEVKVADGSATSWTMGYPLYSAPVITINGQPATIGLQGSDNNRQFYWQPGSPSISYDSSLPKLPDGTVLTFTYVGESPVNTTLDNLSSQTAQAALELNSGIVDEITSALNSTASGMNTDQATVFGQGLLDRYGKNDPIALSGTTRYIGLVPGTVIGLFLPEMLSAWNAQLPIVKLTTTVQMGVNGLIWTYSIDATNGPSISNWTRAWRSR
jgi:hypothetical protein